MLLLGGAAAHALENGTLTFTYIGLEGVAGWLIFLAFGIKCAFPFLHNWLTDAYPEATPTGTVFLTAFTTKDRGLRPRARLPRHRGPGLRRRADDLLPPSSTP